MAGKSSPTTISTRLERIAKLARDAPTMKISTLAHNIDLNLLEEAYRRTRKGGAVGVDGRNAKEYAVNLQANLRSLLDRAKSGTYRAPPVRRVHIPKGDGKETRPLGIPTFEDKILQRAVAMVLEAVYEQSFLDCSYGFRPERSAHQLLADLWSETSIVRGGWIVEIDIRKYFDAIPHASLIEVVRQRVVDGVLIRLIGKWLNAGIFEDGELSKPDSGTPQGGVISPLLANIFLHAVLDASSQGHGATPSQGHGARETERTTRVKSALDRPRRPPARIGLDDGASGKFFAGSWGHPTGVQPVGWPRVVSVDASLAAAGRAASSPARPAADRHPRSSA